MPQLVGCEQRALYACDHKTCAESALLIAHTGQHPKQNLNGLCRVLLRNLHALLQPPMPRQQRPSDTPIVPGPSNPRLWCAQGHKAPSHVKVASYIWSVPGSLPVAERLAGQ